MIINLLLSVKVRMSLIVVHVNVMERILLFVVNCDKLIWLPVIYCDRRIKAPSYIEMKGISPTVAYFDCKDIDFLSYIVIVRDIASLRIL